jgi:hypothetical protein
MGMSRVLAVAGLLVGGAALYLSVASGLRSVPTAAAACSSSVPRTEIHYSLVSYGVHGVAGCDVRAVIARLNGGGAVWATPRGGTFEAHVPAGLRVRTIVKVLNDGTRRTFPVTATR